MSNFSAVIAPPTGIPTSGIQYYGKTGLNYGLLDGSNHLTVTTQADLDLFIAKGWTVVSVVTGTANQGW